jgi:dolichol-phosphate mannosyltransferase
VKYSIAIPTYNESENIAELLELLAKVLKGRDYEIIVADDDSPDRTWEIVEEAAKRDSRVRSLRRVGVERGLSPSVVDAFDQAEGDILAVMDGDMQHDESYLPALLDAAEAADIVVGSRRAKGGGVEGGWPISRRLASASAATAAKILLGTTVSDPMSGYFAVKRSFYRDIRGDLDPKGFKILLELLYLGRKRGAEIAEIGIFFRSRRAGKSKLGPKVVLQYFASLLKMRFARK